MVADSAQKSLDLTKQFHGHLIDVINECLSEMQKLHIGAAMDDFTAAHELKDGGVMAGYVPSFSPCERNARFPMHQHG